MLKRILGNLLAIVDASMLGRIPRNLYVTVECTLYELDVLVQRWFPPTLGNLRVDSTSINYYERMQRAYALEGV